DYPSHYSAYNRRRHRWLRGDWQIVRWIFNKVPDESRRLVPNPISLVSRWKIVDNLRRSLMEPATLALLIAGWFWLPPGPRFWTLVTLGLLFLPIYFRLIFALIRAIALRSNMTARDALGDFTTSHVSILLNIAFLAHQALVAIDAVVRTIVRSTISHRRLLEWETATEAELGIRKRTPVDTYLDWVPLLAIALGVCLIWRREAIPYAAPFLAAWCFSKLLSNWLNSSPHSGRTPISASETVFLHEVALRTWQYFAKYSNESNHWLIPDNVQEEPYRIAERISPTNLGFLLNSRQAAVEFGYLTLSEFVSQTELTLKTILTLPRAFGHFLNWYDNLTMKPLEPQFISSVDSGNLVASLISLKQGCLDLAGEPVLPRRTVEGLSDHCRMVRGRPDPHLARLLKAKDKTACLPEIFSINEGDTRERENSDAKAIDWQHELNARVLAVREEITGFMPWYTPEFEPLRRMVSPKLAIPEKPLTLENFASYYQDFQAHLRELATHATLPQEMVALTYKLCNELGACRERAFSLAARLNRIVSECSDLMRDMKFSMLMDKGRNLLSIGYDVTGQELAKSCYDLLASEARTATFLAVARDEAIQDSWFRLGRQHTICEKEKVLISWTGTMFEYLMPVIWMRSHPETLLDRAAESAVRAQKAYGENRNVPWGISEAAYSARDQSGNYQYAAFGVPCLALNVARSGTLVISPYSSCLALMVDAEGSVKNLLGMARRKWLTDYGFYESADYTAFPARRLLPRKYELVHCWMAHHQGMSLVAICNVLFDSPFQRWFHAERLVQASELILQERPLRVKPINDVQPRRVLPFGAKTRAAKLRQAT
ncbi:MAG: glycosyl transferase, partial [Acidobacteriaceae bacterium]|nr:glycosyl transferase [Acidobacteriaceae bacterium]